MARTVILKRFTLTQKGTQRLTVGGIKGVSSYTLIKGIPRKINKEHKQMLCRRGEKSLVLLMYNAGLSQSLQRRGKNHSHL